MHKAIPRSLLPLALICTALPSSAGMFDGDALQAVERLKEAQNPRLEKLESAAQNQLELANQLQLLKDEVAKLRGQVELLTFEQEQSGKRQKDFYVDLDARLRKLETAAIENAAKAAQQAPKPDPANEMKDFEASLTLFKEGKFIEAADGFHAFLKAWPGSNLAPNAYYWGGNAHFQLREWARATELYQGLIAKWPEDAKTPDALLKLADAQQESGDPKTARKTLETLVAQYQATPAAAQAKQRLARMSKTK